MSATTETRSICKLEFYAMAASLVGLLQLVLLATIMDIEWFRKFLAVFNSAIMLFYVYRFHKARFGANPSPSEHT